MCRGMNGQKWEFCPCPFWLLPPALNFSKTARMGMVKMRLPPIMPTLLKQSKRGLCPGLEANFVRKIFPLTIYRSFVSGISGRLIFQLNVNILAVLAQKYYICSVFRIHIHTKIKIYNFRSHAKDMEHKEILQFASSTSQSYSHINDPVSIRTCQYTHHCNHSFS